MAEESKRKIKHVNGYKVNHPFSFGNLMYAFFLLVLVASPVVALFIPLIILNKGDPSLETTVNGVDIFYYAIQFLKQTLTQTEQEFPAAVRSFAAFFQDNEALKTAVPYMLLGQAGLIALVGINSVIGLIVFFVNVIKGYLRHSGIVKAITVLDFLYYMFFSLSFLVYYIFFVVLKKQDIIFIWFALIPLGGMLILFIIMSAIRSAMYKDVVFEDDLEYKSDEEKEVVQEANIHTITVRNYEPSNTLPQNISSVGGHAFSEDQNLLYANIPDGIEKLGNGAFANCLRLKVVSLPVSVKEIGFNCFFNCVSLERINYAGSKAQWRKIKRGSNWLTKAKTSEVVCVDGAIVVNPYH